MQNAYKELVPVLYGENGVRFHEYFVAAHDMCFPAHWHELLQILSGNMEVYLNKEHVTAMPGQTVLIMPYMIHCGFSLEQDVHYHMISFAPEKFCNTTIASDKYLMPIINREVTFSAVADNPSITSLMEELTANLSSGSKTHPLCIIGKIYEIIGLLYQHCATDSHPVRKPDKRFAMVLEYINSHYTENISAKDISQKFGYDETYFCRRFKESTGITTMKYIRVLRLEMAQKLLLEGKEDIRHISWQCGFSDISYFSNCFKRHFGLSPTDFRNVSN